MEESKVIYRDYKDPFILTKTKLARICEVTENKFKSLIADTERKYIQIFEVTLVNGKKHQMTDIETLFEIDNSLSNRIIDLTIKWEIGKYSDDDFTGIEIQFAGRENGFLGIKRRRISVEGCSESFTWLNETVAKIEEQVERTIVTNFMYKIKGLSLIRTFTLFLAVISLGLALFTISQIDSSINKRQKLTNEQKLALIEMSKNVVTDEEKHDFIYQANLKSIQKSLHESHKLVISTYFKNVKTYAILVPILLIIGIFTYLIKYCYPQFIFEWGDIEEWHTKLIDRRKTLWNLLVGSLLFGIVAGFFVLAFS